MPILPNDTLSTVVNLVNRRTNSDSVIKPPLPHAGFTLDASAVAGFFGGNSAVRAMATVNLVPQRRWFGWYNAAGAYEVAKQYSGIAKSPIFTALFPTGDSDPAKILTVVDGQIDPECTPLFSSTQKGPSSIGPLGLLIARKVSQMPVKNFTVLPQPKKNTMGPCRVTFVRLGHALTDKLNKLELVPSPSIIFTGVATILVSVGGCIVCALVADWFCFASIALGVIANGVACSVIGSGKLYLKHNPPAPIEMDTAGDVVLRTDTDIIVLIGSEGSVRPFTHGRFSLHFGEEPDQEKIQWRRNMYDMGIQSLTTEENRDGEGSTPKVRYIACQGNYIIETHLQTNRPIPVVPWSWLQILQNNLIYIPIYISVILLLFQFLAQLLLIPQGTLFGQLIFIGTLGSSWMYHLYLSTLRLDLQTQALFQMLSIQENKDIFKYQLNTWMETVVFTCLVFRSFHPPMWHSSNSNAYEQRRDDKIALEAVNKRKKQLENKEGEAKLEWEKYNKVAQEAEEAGRVQETADAEVEDAQKAKRCKEEAVKRKSEVKKKEEEATGKVKEKTTKDSQAKEAKEVAEKQKKAVADMKLKNCLEEDAEAKKKQDHDKITRQMEKEDQALQALLDALLPGQTDLSRAFKASLVRKLSEPKTKSSWAYMESDGTLEFNEDDIFVEDESGLSSMPMGLELEQLHIYQEDAKKAFSAWKNGSIRKITHPINELNDS